MSTPSSSSGLSASTARGSTSSSDRRARLYGTFERADADDEDAEEDERRPEDLVDERRDKGDGAQPDRIPFAPVAPRRAEHA